MDQTTAGIIIIVLAIVFYIAFYFAKNPIVFPVQTQTTTTESLLNNCLNSGGTVISSQCCLTANDFPNNCLIGACGCSPDNNHQVKVCQCPADQCWDGSSCVSITQTSTQTTSLTTTQTIQTTQTTTTTSITLFPQTQSVTSSITPPPIPT